ncbi:MAG: hypothetical protein JWN25_3464 [Verrucomicrobiales bacterium]|nr:hypothetical protein [Verrucomicrobiales bacterium]
MLCFALFLSACSQNPYKLLQDFCATKDALAEVDLAKRVSQLKGNIMIYYLNSDGLPVGSDAPGIKVVEILYEGKHYEKTLLSTNTIGIFTKNPMLFGSMDSTVKLIKNFSEAKSPEEELQTAKALIAFPSRASFDFQDSNHVSLGPNYLGAKYVTIRYGTNVMERSILHTNTVGTIIMSE